MNPLIQVAELISEPGEVIVVDVRHSLDDPLMGLRAYAQGHLPNAAFLSVEEDLSGEPGPNNGGRHPLPRPEDFAKRLAELGAQENTLIVAYDDAGGTYAARLWWLARWIGHLRVAVLDGGLQAWTKAGGKLSTDDYKPRRQGRMAVHPSLCPRWTLDMIEGWVAAGSEPEIARLLDARAQKRFLGEVEPYDPVAGHIPGAENRPATENLDHDGRFKSREQLLAEFEDLLQGADPASVVHSCGSGITACHNLLAMEVAGLAGSALYAGSWSEWCDRPSVLSRRAATGH